jgi:hypothetical protein
VLRKNLSQEAARIYAIFSYNLATNPIDFYYVMWLSPNARIEGVFIEYKRNLNPICDLLEHLAQVGEGKLFSFYGLCLVVNFAAGMRSSLLDVRSSVLPYRMLNLLLKLSDGFACIFS